MPKCRQGIRQVFQDVGNNDGIEPAIAKGVWPVWIIEVPLYHPFAKALKDPDAHGVNLKRGELGMVDFDEWPGDGAGPCTDLQYFLSHAHKAHDLGSRGVRGRIYAVSVYLRRGFA